MNNPVDKSARIGLLTLATLRATRFITSDWLGEWALVSKARAWAARHEETARRALYEEMRADIAPRPLPPYDHWAPADDEDGHRSWQAKLVKGLDCGYCWGYWAGVLILAGELATRTRPLRWTRPLWNAFLATFALNYVVGHIWEKLDA